MGRLKFLIDLKSSDRTMTLGSTQPLTRMSIMDISYNKGGRCLGLKTLPPSCADCLEIWEPVLSIVIASLCYPLSACVIHFISQPVLSIVSLRLCYSL